MDPLPQHHAGVTCKHNAPKIATDLLQVVNLTSLLIANCQQVATNLSLDRLHYGKNFEKS